MRAVTVSEVRSRGFLVQTVFFLDRRPRGGKKRWRTHEPEEGRREGKTKKNEGGRGEKNRHAHTFSLCSLALRPFFSPSSGSRVRHRFLLPRGRLSRTKTVWTRKARDRTSETVTAANRRQYHTVSFAPRACVVRCFVGCVVGCVMGCVYGVC